MKISVKDLNNPILQVKERFTLLSNSDRFSKEWYQLPKSIRKSKYWGTQITSEGTPVLNIDNKVHLKIKGYNITLIETELLLEYNATTLSITFSVLNEYFRKFEKIIKSYLLLKSDNLRRYTPLQSKLPFSVFFVTEPTEDDYDITFNFERVENTSIYLVARYKISEEESSFYFKDKIYSVLSISDDDIIELMRDYYELMGRGKGYSTNVYKVDHTRLEKLLMSSVHYLYLRKNAR